MGISRSITPSRCLEFTQVLASKVPFCHTGLSVETQLRRLSEDQDHCHYYYSYDYYSETKSVSYRLRMTHQVLHWREKASWNTPIQRSWQAEFPANVELPTVVDIQVIDAEMRNGMKYKRKAQKLIFESSVG